MTTIAVTATQMAADGLRTWGDQVCGRAHKKIKHIGHVLYGFTGLTAMFDPIVEWHQDGARPKDLPECKSDSGWSLIVVDRFGISKYTSTCPYPERFDPPIAFGAGCDYAMGAMWAGRSAADAIRLVAENCSHTGGEIQVIDIAEALGLNRLEATE